MMQSAQLQLQNVVESANRDRDRLLLLQRNLADSMSAAAPVLVAPAPNPGEPFIGTFAQQLDVARNQLRALELRLKPEHPDIGRAKRVIAELERKAEAEALNQPLSAQTPPPIVNIDRAAQSRVEAMKAEIQELQSRLESAKREAARLQDQVAGPRLARPGGAGTRVAAHRADARLQHAAGGLHDAC